MRKDEESPQTPNATLQERKKKKKDKKVKSHRCCKILAKETGSNSLSAASGAARPRADPVHPQSGWQRQEMVGASEFKK